MFAIYSREEEGKKKEKMKNHDRARVESYFRIKIFNTARVDGWISSLHPLASYFLRVMGDDFPEWIKTSLKWWS